MFIFFFLFSILGAFAAPDKYTELLPFVQPSPEQGETNTCLFMASTGAVELLANKKNNLTNPKFFDPYDLSESWLIHASGNYPRGKHWFEIPVYRFNNGYGIHAKDWPFNAWNGTTPDYRVWNWRDSSQMKKVAVPKVETVRLFDWGNKWATYVLNESHIEIIKSALVKYRSPVIVTYNDDYYWHVILIVGYDDKMAGDCYEISKDECAETKGSFYIRDSFGLTTEIRDYDWFKIKGNAAAVVKEK